jgi:hypothetical protein
MRHINYHRVSASTHFELGGKLAQLFKASFKRKYSLFIKSNSLNKTLLSQSKKYASITSKYFPLHIEELKGYAQGLGVEFELFWYLYLHDDYIIPPEKCTSCFSSDGNIIGHNEDNLASLDNEIAIVEKTIDGVTTLGLHYYNGLGGDACSINSFGYVQTINTLHNVDSRIGVPRNVIARWFSETKNPRSDYDLVKKIPQSSGYSYSFCNQKGEVINIETTATKSEITAPLLPFVHTNHYLLPSLKKYEKQTTHPGNSIERCGFASKHIQSVSTAKDMMKLLESVSSLPSNDRRESGTIARMVFDLKRKHIWCWLARESSRGWIQYPISFL